MSPNVLDCDFIYWFIINEVIVLKEQSFVSPHIASENKLTQGANSSCLITNRVEHYVKLEHKRSFVKT